MTVACCSSIAEMARVTCGMPPLRKDWTLVRDGVALPLKAHRSRIPRHFCSYCAFGASPKRSMDQHLDSKGHKKKAKGKRDRGSLSPQFWDSSSDPLFGSQKWWFCGSVCVATQGGGGVSEKERRTKGACAFLLQRQQSRFQFRDGGFSCVMGEGEVQSEPCQGNGMFIQ